MITYFDLIEDDGFRSFVSKRIAEGSQESYSFPPVLPLLYRYRSFSSFAVDDIVKNKITLSSIGEFNDIFDGAIHKCGSLKEIENAAEAKWKKIDKLRVDANLPDDLIRREDVVNSYIESRKKRMITESRLKFRELEYLGTYVCCFSENSRSTLMWAHYADSNKGICLEYDFNNLPSEKKPILRNSIFPIAYTPNPIDVTDLLSERGSQIYKYPLDAAVLCTALNKAAIWNYEQEWRIVWVATFASEKERRLAINSPIQPTKVLFGYHFLKSFFYYNYRNKSERENGEKALKSFIDLILYMREHSIKAAVMVPTIGSYQLEPHDIPVNELYRFVMQHFHNEQPKSMHFYYTIHDYLMDLVEKPKEEQN